MTVELKIDGIVAILALPLLVPLAMLVFLKGLIGLRDARFELWFANEEGLSARIAGTLVVVLSLLLLGFCTILFVRAIGV